MGQVVSICTGDAREREKAGAFVGVPQADAKVISKIAEESQVVKTVVEKVKDVPPKSSETTAVETVISKIKQAFPGAMTNNDLITRSKKVLAKHGYTDKTTLVATSLCCDEVNRELEHDFCKRYDFNFRMGGLAGFPFGGATSFGAMAHHIPDGGSCIVVYGPHVGVDSSGTVGKVNRRGREGASGVCCGSATEAAGFVKKVKEGTEEPPSKPTKPFDAQQTWVRSALLPHAERLANSDDPLVELPLALFDCQDKQMKKIVGAMCGEVHDGMIALLGGIQINTPDGVSDFFLPKVFELQNNKGELIENLLPILCPPTVNPTVVSKVQASFPSAMSNEVLLAKIQNTLEKYGYDESTTLAATSLCCDEVNRELELDIRKLYDFNFRMGGLAGFPFGGATSFGAMAHHIPDKGSCIVFYGPHVGVDATGTVGKVNRRGRQGGSGVCCGSATEAAGFVKKVISGEEKVPTKPDGPFDAQQTWVRSALVPHGERLAKASDPAVELPLALFDCQDTLMRKIVEAMCGEVHDGMIAMVGGIQINTPEGTSDYFMPKVFELKNNKGDTIADLLPSII